MVVGRGTAILATALLLCVAPQRSVAQVPEEPLSESVAEPQAGEKDEPASIEAASDGAIEADELIPEELPVEDVDARRGIDEIVVTAEKREGNLQQTPIAMSVFDMEQMDLGGIQNIEDLSFSIPNLHYGDVLGAANITIRGISTAGGEQATAFHIDGIYQNNPYTASGVAFYDIKNIEVLRGPQGTLWGRNATAGAINVATNPPSFDFETFGDVQVGSYEEVRTRGVLNVPLVDDILAMRVSGVFNRRYGYTENLSSPVRSGDLDDDRSWALRGQLRLHPLETIDWVTRVTYSEIDSNGLSTKIDGPYPTAVPLIPGSAIDIYINAPNPNPTDPRKIYLDSQTTGHRDLLMASTKFAWDLDDMGFLGAGRLTVLGSWLRTRASGLGDLDLSDAFSLGWQGGPNAGPFSMAEIGTQSESSEWVAEAHLSVDTPLPVDWLDLHWLLGGFYLGADEDGTLDIDGRFQLQILPGGPRPGPLLVRTFATGTTTLPPNAISARTTRSYAVFGNVDLDFFDDFGLSGGFRYSWDEKTTRLLTTGAEFIFPDYSNPAQPPSFPPICATSPIDSEEEDGWDRLTGMLKGTWQANPDNMLYASFSVGYKAGVLNNPVNGSLCSITDVPDARPETLYAWEIGSKSEFHDNKARINIAAFAYLYNDIQVTTLVETSLVTQNANEAQVFGGEVEFTWLPFADVDYEVFSIHTFKLDLAMGYAHSVFTDYKDGCDIAIPPTCRLLLPTDPPGSPGPQDWTGNMLPRSPTLTTSITAQYIQEMGRYGNLIPYMRYFFSSLLYFRAANLPRDVQPAYSLLDVSLMWQSPGERFRITAFVNNAMDVDVISTKLISSPLLGAPTVSSYNPPRTWGVRLGLDW